MKLPKPKRDVFPGYHTHKSELARHRAMLKAMRIKNETPLAMGRHFLLLSTLTKRTNPKASKIFKADSAWLFK